MEEKQELISSNMEMTAGEMLRNARTTGRRKREIATISKLLCIREDFLTALEEGNYRVIPEDVYILGFARSYAVELGLDPDEVILKLKRELGLVSEKKDEEQEVKTEEKKENVKINKETIQKYIKTYVEYVKKHWIWFVSGLCAVILLFVLIAVFSGKSEQTQIPEVQQISTNTNVTTTETVIKEPDFRYPVRERFESKNRKESQVVLQAEKESWVKIEDARGNTVFSRVLVPGDVYYMPNLDNLKGTFGNVGGIDVWVDGQLIKKLGPANTRKTGISMAPNALKAVGVAE
ncbi:MAG: DUF4115 domain-containing protein [Alphaproteobacteria bacterium]|nr:DUF4115 domain-containing protein [Alphaproteobacteria bacterium]